MPLLSKLSLRLKSEPSSKRWSSSPFKSGTHTHTYSASLWHEISRKDKNRSEEGKIPTLIFSALPSTPSPSDMKHYKCKLCHCGFHNKSHLNRHLESVHKDARPYPCPFPNCDSSFKRRDNMVQHMLTHKGKRKAPLSLCARPPDTQLLPPPLELRPTLPARHLQAVFDRGTIQSEYVILPQPTLAPLSPTLFEMDAEMRKRLDRSLDLFR